MNKIKSNKIQVLRAISIIGVILIHTCPPNYSQVIYRPFINFSVATFLFLSGYLTKIQNENWISFYKKRILKVIIPYIIWSIIYTCFNNELTLKKLVFNILTTGANKSLYYIFVYIKFVLLTPILGKLTKTKYKYLLFITSPLSLIIFKYYPLITGIVLNKYISILWSISCLGWFNYYYLGLMVGNKIINKKHNTKKLTILYAFSISLQILEGGIFLALNDNNCGTQLKLTTMISNIVFLFIIYNILNNNKIKINSKILTIIGNYSFGIYLSHLLIIQLLKNTYYLSLPFIINSFIVLILNLIVIQIINKIMDKKINKWIGFT